MLTSTRASLVLAVSSVLLLGCSDDAGPVSTDDRAEPTEYRECTERDNAWFGRRSDGTMISSQTREACEQALL